MAGAIDDGGIHGGATAQLDGKMPELATEARCTARPRLNRLRRSYLNH